MGTRIKELEAQIDEFKLQLRTMEIYRKDEETGKWFSKEDKLSAYKLGVKIESMESKLVYLRLKEKEKEQRRELAKNQVAIERAKKETTKDDVFLKLIATMAQTNSRDVNRRLIAAQHRAVAPTQISTAKTIKARIQEINESPLILPDFTQEELEQKSPEDLRKLAILMEIKRNNPQWMQQEVLRAYAAALKDLEREEEIKRDRNLLDTLIANSSKTADEGGVQDTFIDNDKVTKDNADSSADNSAVADCASDVQGMSAFDILDQQATTKDEVAYMKLDMPWPDKTLDELRLESMEAEVKRLRVATGKEETPSPIKKVSRITKQDRIQAEIEAEQQVRKDLGLPPAIYGDNPDGDGFGG